MTLTYLGDAILAVVAVWAIYDNFKDSKKSTSQLPSKVAEEDADYEYSLTSQASTDAGYCGPFSDDN